MKALGDVMIGVAVGSWGWLLFGEPWLARRRRERLDRTLASWHRDVDLLVAYAEHGRAGLERVLLADLRAVLIARRLDQDPEALIADLRAGRPIA